AEVLPGNGPFILTQESLSAHFSPLLERLARGSSPWFLLLMPLLFYTCFVFFFSLAFVWLAQGLLIKGLSFFLRVRLSAAQAIRLAIFALTPYALFSALAYVSNFPYIAAGPPMIFHLLLIGGYGVFAVISCRGGDLHPSHNLYQQGGVA